MGRASRFWNLHEEGAPGSVDSTRRGVTSSEDPLEGYPVLETPRGGALLVLETPTRPSRFWRHGREECC